MSRRVLVVAPGRGSYGPRELGSLGRVARESERGEAMLSRIAAVLPSIAELDARTSFSPDLLAAENASALIFAGSMLDFALFPEDTNVCGVIGNSLGFYTALALSGTLSLEAGARLVVTIARL